MGKFIDLSGQSFGRLTATKPIRVNEPPKRPVVMWECSCSCGGTITVASNRLLRGKTKSCGCLRRETTAERVRTHGLTGSPEYIAYQRMMSRCHNPKNNRYRTHGARGVAVCQRWAESFQNFYDDMGPRPSPEHSIDRIDNNGNYCPENCRWATDSQQARNTRRTRLLTYKGKTLSLVEWAEITGLNSTTIRQRIDSYGWSVERALATQVT